MSTLFSAINLVSRAVAVTDCFYVSDFVAKLLQTPTGHMRQTEQHRNLWKLTCKFEAVTEKQAINTTAALCSSCASGSGAMIALIVIGITVILAILLIAMKTYNR